MNPSSPGHLVSVAVLFLAGCTSKTDGASAQSSHHREKEASGIATIHLSTTLVWRWDDVVTAIQPDFKFDVNSNFASVVTTSQSNQQRGSSSSYGVNLAGALASVKSPPTKSTAAGDEVSHATRAESDEGVMAFDNSNTSRTADASSPDALPAPNSTMGVTDAMTHLQTLNALYEESGLLNNFAKGLIQRPNYVPYIIRTQLTVLPKHRQEPYDLFVDLKLEPESGRVKTSDPSSHAPAIVVVPLLVTDALESAQQKDLSQISRQIRAGVSAGAGFEKLSADARHALNDLSSSLSYRPNSLFAIGKSGVNSLLIRLGANRFGSDYEMIPLTHSISFVALINRDFFSDGLGELPLKITATPTYRDALIDDTSATKQDLVGGAIEDEFVIQLNPLAYRYEGGSVSDYYCPGKGLLVVVRDTPQGATAVVHGLLDWGNRQVYGDLHGELRDRKRTAIAIASKITHRQEDGTVTLNFDSIGLAIPRDQWPDVWKFDLLISSLKTDANYFEGVPNGTCEFTARVIGAPAGAAPKLEPQR